MVMALHMTMVSTGMGGRVQVQLPGAWHLSRHVTSHPGQLSLAIPSWVGTKVPAKGW